MTREFRVNEAIRAREVRLIDVSGAQVGIVPLREALRIAYERALDLVEVAPTARPPVCRILDYGKFKYEQSKREREARRKQRLVDIKEVKMRPNIEDHDFGVKLRSTSRFLQEGNKVKVTIMFRGREIVHADLARQLLDRLCAEVQQVGLVERPARVEGRNMFMILAPRPEVARGVHAAVRGESGRAAARAAAPPGTAGGPAGEARG
ncbi:MAG: translation initiation factor IF-3 [Acetobacteraceae bacterium]|nr:translation initiation factor IF-3 [Acetobacteraceae bacterium]